MKVLGTICLIKPDKLPQRTESGNLIVPETSTELLPEWGEVIDTGSECDIVKIGERVIFPRRSSNVIVIDGVDYFLVNEHRLTYISEKLKKELK